MDKGWDGYKILSNSPLLEGTSLKKGDILKLRSRESDGAPLARMENGIPILDDMALGFFKSEIIGFDHVVNRAGADMIATWIVFKRSITSGIVINVASTNWCSHDGIGVNPEIQQITATMIQKIINKETIFSDSGSKLFPALEMGTLE